MSAPSNVQKLRGDGQPARLQDNIGAVINPIAKALNETPIMGAAPPAWIRPDIVGGYAQAAAPEPVVAFHKDALGYVHAKVSVTHAAGCGAGTAAFVFPIGYRPSEMLTFTGMTAAAGAVGVTVDASGNFANFAALGAGASARLVLSFLAEQ